MVGFLRLIQENERLPSGQDELDGLWVRQYRTSNQTDFLGGRLPFPVRITDRRVNDAPSNTGLIQLRV